MPRLCMDCYRAGLLPVGARRVETSGYVSIKTEDGWRDEFHLDKSGVTRIRNHKAWVECPANGGE